MQCECAESIDHFSVCSRRQNGVSVFVLPGAVLNVSDGNVILVQDHSTMLNQDTLNQSADENDAISSQGAIGHNVLTNSGTVTP